MDNVHDHFTHLPPDIRAALDDYERRIDDGELKFDPPDANGYSFAHHYPDMPGGWIGSNLAAHLPDMDFTPAPETHHYGSDPLAAYRDNKPDDISKWTWGG